MMSSSVTVESHHKLRLWEEGCPHQMSTVVINGMAGIKLEESVHLAHRPQYIIRVSQAWDLGAGTEEEATVYWLALHGRLSLLMYTTQDHPLELAPPTVSESLPTSINYPRKCPADLSRGQSYESVFSTGIPSFHRNLDCVKLTKTNKQHPTPHPACKTQQQNNQHTVNATLA